MPNAPNAKKKGHVIRSVKLQRLLLAVAFMAGGAVWAAPPTLVAPRLTQAPIVDGELSKGEWDDAAASTGLLSQFGKVAHPRQAIFWIKYDATNIYLACRSSVFPSEERPKAMRKWSSHDSSIVVGLASGRPGRGRGTDKYWENANKPAAGRKALPAPISHFLLRANLKGKLDGREIFWELEGAGPHAHFAGRRFPHVKLRHPHPGWNAGATFEQSLADGVWVVEIRMPLANLNVADIKAGEAWGLLLARDYSGSDQTALTLSSDWRFGDGWGHYGRAFYNNYRLENEYVKMTLGGVGPAVQLLDLGDFAGGAPAPTVAVKNTGDTDVRIVLSCAYRIAYGFGGGKAAQKHTLKLKPGARETHTFEPVNLPPGELSTCHIRAQGPGGVLLDQRIPMKPGWGADRAEAVSDVYFFSNNGLKGPNYALATSYDPIDNSIHCRITKPLELPGAEHPARGEVTVIRAGAADPVATFPMPLPRKGGPTIKDMKLPELDPALYEAVVAYYAEDGKVVARSRQTFIRYDHRKDLPWLFEKVGKSDAVLPGWDPIRSQEAGGRSQKGAIHEFTVWGRDYRVDGSGLIAAMQVAAQEAPDSEKHNILAEPVRFALVQHGKPVALTAEPAPNHVEVADHEASWKGAVSGNGWRIETGARMEYDGYVEHRVRIVPLELKPETRNLNALTSLRLVIPLKPEVATHLHAVGSEWFRSTVSSIALGSGDGRLWHSGQNSGGSDRPRNANYGKKLMTVGNFRPYVWVGNIERGLAFMADSDQGWVPDDSRKVPAIEVVRDNDTVSLVLNLVARSFTFAKPREVVCSLQATPIRPRPDNHRLRRQHVSMSAGAFSGGLHGGTGWSWNGQEYRHWGMIRGHGSTPYPPSWDISTWYREETDKGMRGEKSFHGRERWVYTPYQGQNTVMTYAEVEDPRMPAGKQASDVYGYIYPHIAPGLMEAGNGAGTMAVEDVDYRLWCYRNWIKHVGLKGMYFDLTQPFLTANPRAGFGYVIDLPDRPALHGKVQPGFGLTRVRDFHKRLRTLFVENGVEHPYIWIHSTDGNMVSAFAFADVLMDGENKPTVTEKLSISRKIPPGRQQAMRCSAGGLAYTQLGMFQGRPKVKRDVTGWFMLHDVEHPSGCGIKLNWAGIDLKRPAAFLPYWAPRIAAAMKTSPAEVYASAWRQDDALRVLVYNRNDDTVTATIKLDLAALGLHEGHPLTVTVPVLKRNYRLFKVRAQQGRQGFEAVELEPKVRGAGELSVSN